MVRMAPTTHHKEHAMTTPTTTTITKFVVGETYWCRSAVDYDTQFTFTVTARTPKRMTIDNVFGRQVVVGIKVDEDGVEWALPMGRYSMAPVIRADREFEN